MTTYDDGHKPVTIAHLSDSGDLKLGFMICIAEVEYIKISVIKFKHFAKVFSISIVYF